jgi:hypothetical protein
MCRNTNARCKQATLLALPVAAGLGAGSEEEWVEEGWAAVGSAAASAAAAVAAVGLAAAGSVVEAMEVARVGAA